MLFISGPSDRLRSGAGDHVRTDLLLRLILLILGRSARFTPVLRMAIAYPLSSRFRTGLTIGIFAVVMFSVIFMATLFKVNDILLTDTEQFTGGFDLRVGYSSNNPVDDLPHAIARQQALRRADMPCRLADHPAGGAQQGEAGAGRVTIQAPMRLIWGVLTMRLA
jgi:hypothetical protein